MSQLILCDANVLIEFYKNNFSVLHALNDIDRGNLAVSVVMTQAELCFGVLNKSELQRISANLALICSLSITQPISVVSN